MCLDVPSTAQQHRWALIIRIEFWGILYYTYNQEPPQNSIGNYLGPYTTFPFPPPPASSPAGRRPGVPSSKPGPKPQCQPFAENHTQKLRNPKLTPKSSETLNSHPKLRNQLSLSVFFLSRKEGASSHMSWLRCTVAGLVGVAHLSTNTLAESWSMGLERFE